MSYAELTVADPSRLKRFVQHRRFADAIRLLPKDARTVLDFGAGNGELSRRIATARADVSVTCYEPSDWIHEARELTGHLPNVHLTSTCDRVPDESIDVAFCLEVFEHLPPKQTAEALARMYRALRPSGMIVIGVPIEVGPPAFLKGIFRMTRRPDQFDGKWPNIMRATLGRGFDKLPIAETIPGFPFYPYHVGFDYRRLRGEIAAHFKIERTRSSPFAPLGPIANSEVYFVGRK